MPKLYENFHIFHFQKRIVSAETIRGNTVFKNPIFKERNFILSLEPKVKLKEWRIWYWYVFASHPTVQWCKIFYCAPEDFGFPKLSSPSSFILDAKPCNKTHPTYMCAYTLLSFWYLQNCIQCVYVLSTTYMYVM